MITDHAYRYKGTQSGQAPRSERPCEYMNCRKSRAEHERAVSGIHNPTPTGQRGR